MVEVGTMTTIGQTITIIGKMNGTL